ncbi:MAG TPA: PGPGW domain-containing protein [Edaphobacter sp.]
MGEVDTGGKWIRKGGGWSLLIIGMAGCVLPVAPGIPLVLAGLVLLAQDYAWARKLLRRLKRWMLRMRQMAKAKREAKVALVRPKSAEES